MLSFDLQPTNHPKVSQSETRRDANRGQRSLHAAPGKAAHASMSKPCASTLMNTCVNAAAQR